MNRIILICIFGLAISFFSCKPKAKMAPSVSVTTEEIMDSLVTESIKDPIQLSLEKYVKVDLKTDLSKLTEKEKLMIPLMIKAAKIMDDIFWMEAYGDKSALLDSISDLRYREFAAINYGPWDRLDGNKPFMDGVMPKAAGAGFYPKDITKDEFDKTTLKDKKGLYSMVTRDTKGKLMTVPYHVYFKDQVKEASDLVKQAAALAEDAGLKKYLSLRAEALLTDDYKASDLAWMDMKDNTLYLVKGPIESYEDQLYGYRASHEAFVLVKDQEWSKRLAKFATMLPGLQEGIPVDAKYKKEKPGTASDLNAYDAIYYAGDCNSGSKTIAINLPNDETVQLKKGTRRLQLKNTIEAKFETILKPMADLLIAADQRKNINGEAFFSNVMFHEVAHGLGIKNTINGKGTVREALKENYAALEEGKADVLGLYMIQQLHKQGEITGDMQDYIVTFVASIFRSIRFGASSAHGKANLLRFNYFKEQGAIVRGADGTYSVDFTKFDNAVEGLTKLILQIQGDGDYEGLSKLMSEKCILSDELKADLDRLAKANIPVDIIFNQGLETLGLIEQ